MKIVSGSSCAVLVMTLTFKCSSVSGFVGECTSRTCSSLTNAFVGAGHNLDIVSSSNAGVVSGSNNLISGAPRSFIGGGAKNEISGTQDSFIGSGAYNTIIEAPRSSIGGGENNHIGGDYIGNNVISGGTKNEIFNGLNSVISGGSSNRITPHESGRISNFASIGGGQQNVINGNNCVACTIGGGAYNKLKEKADFSFLGGGLNNEVGPGKFSVLGGGQLNIANGTNSNILGGTLNTAQGSFSVNLAQQHSHAVGDDSTVIGSRAIALHKNSIVLSTVTDRAGCHSTDTNQVMVCSEVVVRGSMVVNGRNMYNALSQNEKSVASNTKQVDTLGTKLGTAEARLTDLEGTVENQVAQIDDLLETISMLKGKVETLSSLLEKVSASFESTVKTRLSGNSTKQD